MLKDLLTQTRSFRSFDPNVKIPRETLLGFIDNARISAATRNLQPLKYKIVDADPELEACLPELRFAASLGIKLPPDGHEPTSLIVMCHDTDITPFRDIYLKDIGICAEIIMLSDSIPLNPADATLPSTDGTATADVNLPSFVSIDRT